MYAVIFFLSFYGFSNVYGQDCKNNTFDGGTFDSSLPLILVTTSMPIPSSNEDKILGTMKIFDARPGRTSLSGTANDYDGSIKIGRRGQSSDAIYCKKQYSVKTRWANDTKRDTQLLGLPEDSDWVIQGPYADKTQQRNALMMTLSNSVGMYAPRFVFVELFLIEDGSATVNYNNHYMGTYLLMEQITRGKDRVDVKKLKDSDLSGGYIVKKDKTKDGNLNFMTTGNLVLSMVYPDEESATTEQVNWIGSYISCFEDALYSADFTDSVLGYPNFINISNFIDYFLLSELSNNADSYKFSTYMYKEKADVLNMGPLWDYDLAFGNIADWLDAAASCRPPSMNPVPACTQFWKYEVNARAKVPDTSAWYARLLKDSVFKALVQARWADLRSSKLADTAIANIIATQTTLISEGVTRNFKKWRDPGLAGEIWPEPNTLDKACCYATYQEHVDFLRKYVQGRAAWMDGALNGGMYSIDSAPPALSCCADPQFKSCPKPQGGTCSVSQGDVNAGIGQYYDTACKPGIPGTEGCIGLSDQGACRSCLSPIWDPNSGVGSKSWLKCNLCAPLATCAPPTPGSPTAAATDSPSAAPSAAPNTPQPTKVGDTRNPTLNPTADPTPAPVQPTPKQTSPPTSKIVPTAKPGSPTAAGLNEEANNATPLGVYVAAGLGVVIAIAAIGALLWCLKQRQLKKHNSQLHEGLLQ